MGARDAWIWDIYAIMTSLETTIAGMEGVTESTFWEPRLRSPWAVDVKTNGTLASISRDGGGVQPLRLAYDGSARNLSGPSTQLVSVVSGWGAWGTPARPVGIARVRWASPAFCQTSAYRQAPIACIQRRSARR